MSLWRNGNGESTHEVHEVNSEPIEFDARPEWAKALQAASLAASPPLKVNTLNEIAHLLRTGTYGEVMELAKGLCPDDPDGMAKKLHKWATSPTSDSLPSQPGSS